MKLILYFFFKYYFKIYTFFYFREVKIYGLENIPKDGGVLYSPNHQGAFLDPLLIGAFTPRTITSLTRADVFFGPQKWLFDVFKMLPVYRIRNGYQNLKKNDAIFEKCYTLLGQGDQMLMFSEGGHHDDYFLQKLSKGSSRLVYQAQRLNPSQKIYIQPVGINYGHHKQARCTLHLVFGTPLLVQDYVLSSNSEPQNITLLKEQLAQGMKACLWLPEKTENYDTQKKWINAQNTRLAFADLKQKLTEKNGLKLSKTRKGTVLLGHLLSLPNIIPLWITRQIINRFDDKVFVSSLKYAAGAFLFPLWWLGSTSLLYCVLGSTEAVLFLLFGVISLFLRQKILLE